MNRQEIRKESLAEWFHNNYEEIALNNGWKTQDDCQVPFHELPEENKRTMIEVCERLLNKFSLLTKEPEEKYCDCVIPKPKSAYDYDSNICRDCDLEIKEPEEEEAIEILKARLEVNAGRLAEPLIKEGKDIKEDQQCHKAFLVLAHLKEVKDYIKTL